MVPFEDAARQGSREEGPFPQGLFRTYHLRSQVPDKGGRYNNPITAGNWQEPGRLILRQFRNLVLRSSGADITQAGDMLAAPIFGEPAMTGRDS
ncbi:hypothetical protein [Streptomyces sp. NPDC014006]|uniref:hypothetical protein n=1 Tax=Streptomyces sp. NPDC014006 TaxID=3364870 RepID=UPI0036F91DF4